MPLGTAQYMALYLLYNPGHIQEWGKLLTLVHVEWWNIVASENVTPVCLAIHSFQDNGSRADFGTILFSLCGEN